MNSCKKWFQRVWDYNLEYRKVKCGQTIIKIGQSLLSMQAVPLAGSML